MEPVPGSEQTLPCELLLIAFCARAVNPYLAHEWVRELCENGSVKLNPAEALANYDRALTAGVLKIASKMGVSTLQAYQSAQLFEAVGLDKPFVEKYFTNTPCALGGTDLNRVEADNAYRTHVSKWEIDRYIVMY